MILTFEDVITSEEHARILQQARSASFVDGRTTAGHAAAQVKRNQQIDLDDPARSEITDIVLAALRRHDAFRAAVQPKQLHGLLVSRYEAGMDYGFHVDKALMGDQPQWRSDISMTLFLNDPDEYAGGELAMESGSGELRLKLEARTAVCYPSTTLHRVLPVTRGARLVVVAWIQSLVRDAAAREVLWDLEQAQNAVFEAEGKSRAFDLIVKTQANLLRRWAEP